MPHMRYMPYMRYMRVYTVYARIYRICAYIPYMHVYTAYNAYIRICGICRPSLHMHDCICPLLVRCMCLACVMYMYNIKNLNTIMEIVVYYRDQRSSILLVYSSFHQANSSIYFHICRNTQRAKSRR